MPVAAGRWHKVGWLIDYFVAHGCKYDELPEKVQTPYGMRTIRFIVDPSGQRFVPLGDLSNDETIPESIFGSWEKILGIDVPPNGNAC